ncbi:hypothetical protein [Pedobacter panaciterrae]
MGQMNDPDQLPFNPQVAYIIAIGIFRISVSLKEALKAALPIDFDCS